jgi:urease accessory protein
MRSDTQKQRQGRPYVFTDMRRRVGLDNIISFLETNGALQPVLPAKKLAP